MAEPDREAKKIRQWKGRVRSLTVSQVLLTVLSTACHLIFLLLLARFLGQVIPTSGPDPWPRIPVSTPWLLSAMATAVLLRGLFQALEGPLGEKAAAIILKQARRDLQDTCRREPNPGGTSGAVYAALYHEAVETLRPWASRYLPAPMVAALVPLMVLALAFAVDPLTGFTLLFCGPLVPLFMILIGRLTKERSATQLAALSRLSERLGDLIRGLPTLVPMGRTGWARETLARDSAQHARATLQVLATAFLSALVLEWLTTLSTAIVAVESGLRLLHGHMDLSRALLCILLAPEFFGPLRQLGLRFHAAQDGRAALSRILQYEDAVAASRTRPMSEPATKGARDIAPVNGHAAGVTAGGIGFSPSSPLGIAMRGGTFQWDQGALPLWRDVDLFIETGTVTAVQGPSGSGKSTLARVLLKLETPGGRLTGGTIAVNGAGFETIADDGWHAVVTWLPQRPRIFAGSIRDHFIRFVPRATDPEIASALKEAGLGEWYRAQPEGLDTAVGEEGGRLSGGERQRLALARCLLGAGPFLVLDEFTAHLDPDLEADLLARLVPMFSDRAVLLISHRPRTLALADRRLRFEPAGHPTWEGPAP